MKKEAISKLIHSGESETVEFKENFNMEAFETVSAFANTKGGTILIGVSDRGKINGVQRIVFYPIVRSMMDKTCWTEPRSPCALNSKLSTMGIVKEGI